ncbi:MAG: type I restriction enzyme HsdR N-terminal domain-containing protein [Paludibacter sp.]|nr:type I restriction enzyme HsdR N-terminal domain-containing protein [Paludibacter sp.]
MFALNLPVFEYKIRQFEGKTQIFDFLRRKFVALTPEEWVRQHFVNYLIVSKGFPAGRLSNECNINLNGLKRRCDTVLYDEYLKPLVIIEYKAPEIPVSQTVFNQIAAYNMVLKVKYLIVSNGIKHYCCRIDYEHQKVEYIESIPDYKDL